MADGIKVHIYGDYDDKDVNKAIRDLQGLRKNATTATPAMGGLSKAMIGVGGAVAGLFALSTVTNFMGDAIDQGSALEESMSKVGVVFGESASEIVAWSDDSAQAFGQSQAAALEAVGTYGNLFQAFGVGRDESAKMSKSLVELAADLASFNNTSVDDALVALRSGLSGETEPLKRYGIAINDARLKTEALSLGLYKGKGALDVNAKSQAAYALIMKDSTLAQGDFARTSDGFANTMRIVSAEVEDAKATIGTALVGAIQDAIDAFGGSGGIGGAIEHVSENVADFITGVGGLTTGLADLASQSFTMAGATDEGGTSLLDLTATIGKALPITSQLIGAYSDLTAYGERLNDERAVEQRMIDTTASRYTALAVAMDPAKANLLGLAGASEQVKEEMVEAKTASDRLKESFDRYSLGDNVILALREVAKAAREAKGDLTSNKGAAIDLRGEFATAASAVLEFATANGTSAANVLELWDDGLGKLRRNLIKNGVKPADVDAFINERTWMTRFTLLADVIGNGRAAEAMRLAGLAVGKSAWQGMVQGLDQGREQVRLSAGQLAASARYGAMADLDSHSPSRKFIAIGKDVGAGLSIGIDSSVEAVVASAKAIVKQAIDAAKSERDSALAAIKGVSDSIVGQVLGNVGFSTTDAEGNALTPQQIVASILGSTANQQAAVNAIAAGVGSKLPPALLQQMLTMPPETAIALANYLGGAEGSAMLTQLTTNYAALAETTKTLLGDPMGLAWGMVGDKSAKDMLISARATIADLAPGFSNFVRRQLSTTIDVGVRFSGGGIDGARAEGGPVSGGGTYLVGERGPELFTPSASGSITPNSSLRGGGGRSINVTVNAGMGTDGYDVGRKVVDAIKKYERVNGPVFQAA